jgi:magnesium transporter
MWETHGAVLPAARSRRLVPRIVLAVWSEAALRRALHAGPQSTQRHFRKKQEAEAMQLNRTPEIRTMIARKEWSALRALLTTWPEAEIADLLFALDPADRLVVFRLLPREQSGTVFALLESDQQNELLAALSNDEARRLLADLSPDDRTELFEELPGQVTQKLLNLLSPDDLRETRELLGYPEESVGRLMTPDYVAVRAAWTIEQALAHARAKARGSETINVLYVIDRDWKLLDALDIRRFIMAQLDQTVESIMDHQYVALSAFDDREEAVRVMERYDLAVLPVVDSDGVLVGIVTFDDVLDVAEEEATEDFHRHAAVAPLHVNYRDASPFMIYRRRINWLIVLVFVNIFSGAAIATFEDTIAAAVALVFFLPLLIDSAGNAGAQASTLMIRALALGDVKMGDWARLFGREVGIAGALGLTMGAAVSLIGLYRGGPEIALVVAVTMVIVVIVGSVIGFTLPFIFNRLKRDPATASGPLITSLADISGVLIYFSLATWLLDIH